MLPALGAQNLSHWTTRDLPYMSNLNDLFTALLVPDTCTPHWVYVPA